MRQKKPRTLPQVWLFAICIAAPQMVEFGLPKQKPHTEPTGETMYRHQPDYCGTGMPTSEYGWGMIYTSIQTITCPCSTGLAL